MSEDSKSNMLEHSQAKVRLLNTYLTNYLSVVTNARSIDRVRIFDWFCGRGIYDDDNEGSPIATLRVIKNLYFARKAKNQRVPRIDCFFSDQKPPHVQGVIEAVSRLHLHYPEIGGFECVTKQYDERLRGFLAEGSRPSNEKSFVFLDPYGYKDIKPSEIRTLLGVKAEVLLFLPIQFMYRFEGDGTPMALQDFVSEMKPFDQWEPSTTPTAFVDKLKASFSEFLGPSIYVSTFLIQKDAHTLFSLFFFTAHLLGHERMIDAKWSLDQDFGKGWSFRRSRDQDTLGANLEMAYLERVLSDFFSEGPKTNCDVYEFAVVKHEYRATHAKKVCEKLIKEGRVQVRVSTGSGKPKGMYINYEHFRDGKVKIIFEGI